MLPIDNVKAVVSELIAFGITNDCMIKGILCCIAKESGFMPRMEKSYANTDNAKLRKYFGDRLNHLSEFNLNVVKKNDVDFFGIIYGGILGNSEKGDGYKYRGAGFGQTTGKDLFIKRTKELGIDLVKNPELLNTIPVASKEIAVSMRNRLKLGEATIKARFNTTAQTVNDTNLAVQIAVNANAGWGKDKRGSDTEKKAFEYLPQIETIYKQIKP